MVAIKNSKVVKNTQSRVFTIEGGANPGTAPLYQGYARAMGLAWPQGAITPVRIPSASIYDRFDVVATLQAQQGLPAMSIESRYRQTLSDLLRLVKKGCAVDIQIHIGSCKAPNDFLGGWTDGHIIVLQGANATDYTTGDLGALDSNERAMVMETVPFTGLDLFEIGPMTSALQAETLITDEIVDVTICDSVTCGSCGLPSDGCQVVFAVVSDASGSPGIPAAVIWSSDGGATWNKRGIFTLGLAETPTAIACVGTDLVVLTNNGVAHHWIPITDMINATGSWTKVTTGYVATHGPNQIVSVDRTHTWIVGDLGYIYFSSDIRSGVSVQSAGDLTVQSLNAIDATDILTIVAVGAANALLTSINGGTTWSLVTGPAVGIALNTVAVSTDQLFQIGTAGGNLYYTRNAGLTWSLKAFPGSGSGVIRDVVMVNDTVGYMAHDTAGFVGRVLRTIDGGNSWYVTPDNPNILFPSVRRINRIAACRENINIAFYGGLGNDANDGKLLKASA